MILSEIQRNAAHKFASNDASIAWHKPGLGKTRLALFVFSQTTLKTLVVITRRIAFDDWAAEVVTCKCRWPIFTDKSKNISMKWQGRRVILMSADGLNKMPAIDFPNSMLVIDELYMFSNAQSQRSTLLRQVAKAFAKRLGLSGSIMPAKDNISIFGQLWAMGLERRLGIGGISAFRSKYQNNFKDNFGRRQFTNREGAQQEIIEALGDLIDVQFPPQNEDIIQIVKCAKSPAQKTAIAECLSDYKLEDITFDFAIQVYHAVNGVSNGHDPKFKSMKMQRTIALIDELTSSGQPVVVWCAYRKDIIALQREKLPPHLVWTSENKFDVATWNKGEHKLVLATEGMGSSVNFFAQVQYAIYYSYNYKLLDLQQSMGRHKRKSSQHDHAHYYIMQTMGSYDAHTWDQVTKSNKSEKDFIKACIDMAMSIGLDN